MDPRDISELSENERVVHEERAGKSGVSIEDLPQEPLVDSILDPPRTELSLVEAYTKYFGEKNGVELNLGHDWPDRPPIDFGDFDE